MPGASLAPTACVKKTRSRRRRFAENVPAFPARMVLTVSFVLSLVIGLSCHHPRAMQSIVASLISASGYQPHTTSPSACTRIRLVRDKRPPHPAPNVL